MTRVQAGAEVTAEQQPFVVQNMLSTLSFFGASLSSWSVTLHTNTGNKLTN